MLSDIENEFRHSLRKGYNRLRQAQGVRWTKEPVECALELLGDPHVLRFHFHTNSSAGVTVTIPLVYVIQWALDKDLAAEVQAACKNPEYWETLSLHKRSLADRENASLNGGKKGIHDIIAESLSKYLTSGNCEHLLIDFNCEDDATDSDHVVMSENWKAIPAPERAQPHWLFGSKVASLPDELQGVNRLIRITFPLEGHLKMITLVLGFAFKEVQNRPESSKVLDISAPPPPTADLAFKNMGLRDSIRRLTSLIAREVPRYYSRLGESNPAGRVVVAPRWYRSPDRTPMQAAVDELHRDIARLALRTLKQDWEQPEYGFKFVVAFRQLDEMYHESLRYTPSIYNLHALGCKHAQPESWQAEFESQFKENEDPLKDLFARNNAADDYQAYARKVSTSIAALFEGVDGIDSARAKVAKMIEATNYPSNLTPGYWVMRLNHPEIIQGWLKDPRAKDFSDYPPALLAWESIALPPKIYYSPITDGVIPLGVCAIDASILNHANCSAYDLQEIIDRNAQRLRYILCDEELRNAKQCISDAFDNTGPDLKHHVLKAVLRGFRRTAYYYFGSPEDFFTKLGIPDKDSLLPSGDWVEELNGKYVTWRKLSGSCGQRHLEALLRLDHTPSDNVRIYGRGESDFLHKYLESPGTGVNTAKYQQLKERSRLHQIKFRLFPEELYVLVTDPQHGGIADELIRRFAARCDSAFESYREPLPSGSADELDVFISYNRAHESIVREQVLVLKAAGITVWFDKDMIRPGDDWAEQMIVDGVSRCRNSMVFLGLPSLGPTQEYEVSVIHSHRVRKKREIYPMLLDPSAKIPVLLEGFEWVDVHDPQAMNRIIGKIKSTRPPRADSQTA